MSIQVNIDARTAPVGTLSASYPLNVVVISLAITAPGLTQPVPANTPVTLVTPLGNSFQVVTSQAAALNALTVNIYSAMPPVALPSGTTVSVPAPTLVDLLPLVKSQLGESRTDESRDDELAFLAAMAMQKYNEFKPLNLRCALSSLQGQLTYALPANCREVRDVAVPSQYGYYNDWLFLPMIDTPASSLFGYSDYAFRSPSERIVRQEILTELDHYAQSWAGYYTEYQPAPTLYILPVSVGSGIPIAVRYAADHQNVSTDNSPEQNPVWNTLPPGDWKQVLRLIKWAQADNLADRIVSPMAIQMNGGGNDILTEAWKLSNRADRILLEVRIALGVERTAVLRS